MKSILDFLVAEKVRINGHTFVVGDKWIVNDAVYQVMKILPGTIVYSNVNGLAFSTSLETAIWNPDLKPYHEIYT